MARDQAARPLTADERRLVEEHLPLVHSLASRWKAAQRQNIDQSDLVQVGVLGLMEAARRFDVSKGLPFRSFARTRVEGAIRDTLRAVDPLSRHERQGVRRLETTLRELRVRFGREPDVEELASALQWAPAETRRRLDDLRALQQGLARVLPEPSERGWDREAAEAPYNSVFESELRGRVAGAIRDLPRPQQLVLALYHHERLTLKEVGSLLGVTESRACQIHSAAMRALRQGLRAFVDGAVAVA